MDLSKTDQWRLYQIYKGGEGEIVFEIITHGALKLGFELDTRATRYVPARIFLVTRLYGFEKWYLYLKKKSDEKNPVLNGSLPIASVVYVFILL